MSRHILLTAPSLRLVPSCSRPLGSLGRVLPTSSHILTTHAKVFNQGISRSQIRRSLDLSFESRRALTSSSRRNFAPAAPGQSQNDKTPANLAQSSQVPQAPSASSATPPSTTPPSPTLTATLKAALPSKLTPTLIHENIYNLPNILTFSRLLAAPAVGYLVLNDMYLAATGLFFYAGVTDLIDGWLARRWKQQTVVGSIVDPLADKALMTILTVCLAVKGALPIWLATIILGRDISLAIAAIYYRYASLPSPKSFTRYWDFSLPSAEVHPTTVSKYNTFLQLLLIGATTVLPVASAPLHNLGVTNLEGMMTGFRALVAGTTLWSGLSYLWVRKAVVILGKGSEGEKRRILRRGRVVLAVSFLGCGVVGWALERRSSGEEDAEVGVV